MKKTWFGIVIFSIILSASSFASAGAKEWYEGGTLHNANSREWNNATYENKLATAADWVAKIVNVRSMADLKSKAIEVVSCVSETVKGTGNQKVAEIAVMCMIMMNYPMKK